MGIVRKSIRVFILVISLLLICGGLVGWAWSYHEPQEWYVREYFTGPDEAHCQDRGIRVVDGQFEFFNQELLINSISLIPGPEPMVHKRGQLVYKNRWNWFAWHDYSRWGLDSWEYALAGIQISTDTEPTRVPTAYSVVVPFWLPIALGLVWPLNWIRIKRKRSRQKSAGLCPICSYDLRVSPTRCPECGHTTPQSAEPVK